MSLFCLLIEIVYLYSDAFDLMLVDKSHFLDETRKDKIHNRIGEDILLRIVYLSIYYHYLKQLLTLLQLLLVRKGQNLRNT